MADSLRDNPFFSPSMSSGGTPIVGGLALDGSNSPTADISWNGFRVKELGAAANDDDAVNLGVLKQFVADALANVPGNSVTATGTTFARSLENRFSEGGKVFNVLDFGAVPDGALDGSNLATGTDNRAIIQTALDQGGKTYPVKVVVPPGIYKIGINGPINTETPLQIPSNTTLIVQGTLLHNINPGPGCVIQTPNAAETDTGARYQNIHILFEGNGGIVFPTRTVVKSKKAINIAHVDTFSLKGLKTLGNDIGSYNVTVFHANKGVISDCIIDAGDSIGEDGLHLLGNCDSITVTGNVIYAGDDAFSITQEGVNQKNMTVKNITVSNNIFIVRSSFTAVKILNDAAASNSTIKNITFSNNILAGPMGGALININNAGQSAGNVIDGIKFNNTYGDMTGGTLTGAAVECYRSSNIDFGNLTAKNLTGRGIFLQENTNVTIGPNHYIGDYTRQASLLNGLAVTDVALVSTGTVRFTLSGAPDLSTISAATDYLDVAGFVNAINNGRFNITSFDNTAKTITATSVTSRASVQNETGATASAAVVRRKDTDYGIQLSGGVGVQIVGGRINNVGSIGIFGQLGLTSNPPLDVTIRDNEFTNCAQDSLIQFSAGKQWRVQDNIAYNCSANYFINEVSASSTIDENEFYGNTDKGTYRCRQSFRFTGPLSKGRNNRGTNSDFTTGTVTIPSGSLSAVLAAPTGTYPWADVPSNMKIQMLSLTANTSLGTAARYWSSLSGSTFTVQIDQVAGADVSFSYRLEPSN